MNYLPYRSRSSGRFVEHCSLRRSLRFRLLPLRRRQRCCQFHGAEGASRTLSSLASNDRLQQSAAAVVLAERSAAPLCSIRSARKQWRASAAHCRRSSSSARVHLRPPRLAVAGAATCAAVWSGWQRALEHVAEPRGGPARRRGAVHRRRLRRGLGTRQAVSRLRLRHGPHIFPLRCGRRPEFHVAQFVRSTRLAGHVERRETTRSACYIRLTRSCTAAVSMIHLCASLISRYQSTM